MVIILIKAILIVVLTRIIRENVPGKRFRPAVAIHKPKLLTTRNGTGAINLVTVVAGVEVTVLVSIKLVLSLQVLQGMQENLKRILQTQI